MAYGVLYIESALCVHLRGGVARPRAVAHISMWFRKMAATVKDERNDLQLVKKEHLTIL